MKQKFSTRKLAYLGLLTALVFASNYARIILPISIGGTTAFTLANIVCALSGLILGPIGGLMGFYLTLMSAYGSLSLMNILFFLVMWLVPTVLISNGVDQF